MFAIDDGEMVIGTASNNCCKEMIKNRHAPKIALLKKIWNICLNHLLSLEKV